MVCAYEQTASFPWLLCPRWIEGHEEQARHVSRNAEKKNQLESEVEMCSVKLDRAQKLIGGLGGERDRWSATAESLEAAYAALTGDALVAATTMSYFGAFTATFRQNSVDVISQAIRMSPPKIVCLCATLEAQHAGVSLQESVLNIHLLNREEAQ